MSTIPPGGLQRNLHCHPPTWPSSQATYLPPYSNPGEPGTFGVRRYADTS